MCSAEGRGGGGSDDADAADDSGAGWASAAEERGEDGRVCSRQLEARWRRGRGRGKHKRAGGQDEASEARRHKGKRVRPTGCGERLKGGRVPLQAGTARVWGESRAGFLRSERRHHLRPPQKRRRARGAGPRARWSWPLLLLGLGHVRDRPGRAVRVQHAPAGRAEHAQLSSPRGEHRQVAPAVFAACACVCSAPGPGHAHTRAVPMSDERRRLAPDARPGVSGAPCPPWHGLVGVVRPIRLFRPPLVCDAAPRVRGESPPRVGRGRHLDRAFAACGQWPRASTPHRLPVGAGCSPPAPAPGPRPPAPHRPATV